MLLKIGVSLAWSSLSSSRFLCKFALKKLYLCCYLQFYISYTSLERAKNTLSKKLFRPQETHNISPKTKYISDNYFESLWLSTPRAFVHHLSSFWSWRREIFRRISAQGCGEFVKSSRSCQHCSFFNISLKNMPIQIALDISL